MILTKLTTSNFKKLGTRELYFSEGLNILCGENAKGKSTVLDAIEAALFGMSTVPGKKEHIPTWGQTSCEVSLTFLQDKTQYTVVRSLSSSTLYSNDNKVVANGNSAVTLAISELLGLGVKDFNLFIKSRQGETAGILNFGATELTRKVEEFGGIAKLDELIRASRSSAAVSKQVIDSLSNPQNLAEILSSVGAIRKDIAEKTAELKRLLEQTPVEPTKPKVSSQALRDKSRHVDTERRRLAEQREKLVAAKAVLENTLAASAKLNREVDHKQLTSLKEVFEAHSSKLRKLNSAVSSKTSELNQLMIKQEKAKTAQIQLDKLILSQLSDSVEKELKEELRAAKSKLARVANKVAEARLEVITITERLDSEFCPTCGSRVPHFDRFIEEGKLEAAKINLNKFRGDEAELKEIISGMEEKIRKSSDVEDAIKQSNRIISTYSASKHQEAKLELAELNRELEVVRVNVDKVKSAYSSASEKLAEIASLSRECERKRKEIKEIELDIEVCSSAVLKAPSQAEIDTAVAVENEYSVKLEHFIATTKRLSKERERLTSVLACLKADLIVKETELKNAKKSDQLIKEHSATYAGFSQLNKFLTANRSEYASSLWDSITGYASEFVNASSCGLVGGVSYINGEVFFEDCGITQPITSASGAQRAYIGTAMRIAMCAVLYNQRSVAIFDEPTESMSEHQASLLVSALANLGRQCILITHRDKDQSIASNLIEVK